MLASFSAVRPEQSSLRTGQGLSAFRMVRLPCVHFLNTLSLFSGIAFPVRILLILPHTVVSRFCLSFRLMLPEFSTINGSGANWKDKIESPIQHQDGGFHPWCEVELIRFRQWPIISRTDQDGNRSPNLNSYAERWARSVKEECLSRLILFGQSSLRRSLQQYIVHYHEERNRQGKDNRILFPSRPEASVNMGAVRCRCGVGSGWAVC